MRAAIAVTAALLCPSAHAATAGQKAFMDAATRSIERYIAVPCATPQTAEIRVQLESFADGYLKSVAVVQRSGYPQYDKAVLRAIADVQPLPAADPAALESLADAVLYFHPDIPTYPCNLQPLNGEIPNLQINELPAAPSKTGPK